MKSFLDSFSESQKTVLMAFLLIVIGGSFVYIIGSFSTISLISSVANTQTAAAIYSAPGKLEVGPGKPYATVRAAYDVAAPGDTIEIAAGVYPNEFLCIEKNNLTFRGVGGLAHMKAVPPVGSLYVPTPWLPDSCKNKGIWTILGTNTIVENIEFSGMKSTDGNGAGIRLGSSINLTIRGSYFHENENGIMGGGGKEVAQGGPLGGAGNVLIENSEFARNGKGDGLTHNIYLGRAETLTLRTIYSHDANKGHNVKTRARTNYIYGSRITDETANPGPSFDIDISGGKAYIIGNIIQKSATSDNKTTVIYYYTTRDPQGPHDLYVVNNTIVTNTNALSNADSLRYFVKATATLPLYAKVVNNLFIGPLHRNSKDRTVSVIDNNPTDDANLIKNNLWINSLASAELVNTALYDYHLTQNSKAINGGIDAGSANGISLSSTTEYVHPAKDASRIVQGPMLDIGAYEFAGAPTNLYPEPLIDFFATPTGTDTQSVLTWTSNATSCTGSGGQGEWAGSKTTDGTAYSGLMTGSKTFTLTCTGNGGTASKQVTVLPPGAPTLTLSAPTGTGATAVSIPPGKKTNLTWTATNIGSCTGSGGGWSGLIPSTRSYTDPLISSGSYDTGPLTESKTYTLTCPGLSGGSISKSVTVTVAPETGPTLAQKFHLAFDASEVTPPVFTAPAPSTVTNVVTPAFGQLGELNLANGSVAFVPTANGWGSLFTLEPKKAFTTHAFYNFANADMGSLLNVDGGEIQAVVVGRFSDNATRAVPLSPTALDRQFYIFSAMTGITTGTTAEIAAGNNVSYIRFDLTDREENITIFARAPGAPDTPGSAKLFTVLPMEVVDAMFAEGMPLRIQLTWDGGAQRLYINDTLLAAKNYTKNPVVWGPASRFALGASLNVNNPTKAFYVFVTDILDDFVIKAPGIALPDITIDLEPNNTVSPTSFMATNAPSLTGAIRNIGIGVGNNFPNVFQVANVGHTITLAYFAGDTVSSLASGATATITSGALTWGSNPFSSAGTYEARLCANYTANWLADSIAESNNNNNCGEWTSIIVTAPPSASFSGTPSCTIALGASTCAATLNWTSADVTSIDLYADGSPISPPPSNYPFGSQSRNNVAIPFGDSVYTLQYKGKILATQNWTASCASGTWNGTICATPDLTYGIPPTDKVSPTLFSKTNSPSLTAVARNSGTGVANNFPNVFEVANVGHTQTLGYVAGNTVSLAPGDTTTISSSGGAFTGAGISTIPFLTPGTYEVRLCANYTANGTADSIAESDLTNNCGAWTSVTVVTPPVLTTLAADFVTQTSATLKGRVPAQATAVNAWFRYHTVSPGTCNDTFGTRSPATGGQSFPVKTTSQTYNRPITGLTPGITYYYCFIGENTVKGYGNILSFKYTLPAVVAPTVSTSPPTSVTATSATLQGVATASFAWFRYDTTSPGTCNDTFGTRVPLSGGVGIAELASPFAYNWAVTGLAPHTPYYYCAMAENSAGKTYGTVQPFATP